MKTSRLRVVVVGGGITGLSAAWHLCSQYGNDTKDIEVMLFEKDIRVGGKILTKDFMGAKVDFGPDSLLIRSIGGNRLFEELGVTDKSVFPAANKIWIWTADGLKALPREFILGIPPKLSPLVRSGILTVSGAIRAGLDLVLPGWIGDRGGSDDNYHHDASVGSLVRSRLGNQVADKLTTPLLGGIHAGSIDDLSLCAVAPFLKKTTGFSKSLMRAVRPLTASYSSNSKPVFQSFEDGMGYMVDKLLAKLIGCGVTINYESEVKELHRKGDVWRVSTLEKDYEADGTVLATPAYSTAALLGDLAPDAAGLLKSIKYEGVGVVGLSYANTKNIKLDGTGFLVAGTHLVTGCTWLSSKWSHLSNPDHFLLRAFIGDKNREIYDSTDDEIIALVHEELSKAMGLDQPPSAGMVVRWVNALPKYQVGHLERVKKIQDEVSSLGTIALCGAAYKGLSVPACITQSYDAVAQVMEKLSERKSH
ncbi:MAG: protoporphyrinogen oxidase [Actinobacteria bacterium]|nr:protoporphyrinogen oxidase [Actinomycetota bacterium]MCL6104907.1 protoporphyrinogen oxidase [Actinomycetota bacterium]